MNNRGFTLIELIATIALLAIIAVISYVSISGVIKQSSVNDCKSLQNSLKTAAKEYVSDNRYKRSFTSTVVNNKVTISASTLIANNYLSSPVVNPFTKEEIDASTISISVELNRDYTVKQAMVSAPNFLVECKAMN